jgi:hypothetical protein
MAKRAARRIPKGVKVVRAGATAATRKAVVRSAAGRVKVKGGKSAAKAIRR